MFQSVDQMNKVQIHSEMSSMFDVWAGPALAPGLHSNLNVMETLKSPNGSQLTVSSSQSQNSSQSYSLTVSQSYSLTVSSSQSHILLDILNLLTETKIIFKIV